MIMNDFIKGLCAIEQALLENYNTTQHEAAVYKAELEERQRLGLHGDAAIRHYNEWMQRYQMEHLMVKEDKI